MIPDTITSVFECQGCGHLISGHPSGDCDECGGGHWMHPPKLTKRPVQKATIGLAMLVKDAAESLPTLLGSLNDACEPARSTIIDTGSTDGTPDILRDWGVEPLEREWRNFGENRTELLAEAHGKADYLMLLDADMELEWKGELDVLTEDIGNVLVKQGPIDYRLPLIVRGDRTWYYPDTWHAIIRPLDGVVTEQEVNGFVAHDRGKVTREKLERDLELIRAVLAERPGYPRAMFYLAQTYKDLDRYEDAIACYRQRAEMGGYDEERFYALYEAGRLLCEHRSFHDGAPLLLEAFRMRPHRAEPLRALGNLAHSIADKLPYPVNDHLFVRHADYREH